MIMISDDFNSIATKGYIISHWGMLMNDYLRFYGSYAMYATAFLFLLWVLTF
jgi:hypothetical protein